LRDSLMTQCARQIKQVKHSILTRQDVERPNLKKMQVLDVSRCKCNTLIVVQTLLSRQKTTLK